ncbi:MAG: T9SS type A sorting domain-containing protein [candidate division KSB1 bacterium]|nr:T9SS type A sorting domain-containing protein [candidate division KSB1 bacterium]MDZ7376528.1 T9SS type A sorting domain-containing protein [candidate division KSB1 bacterium]MDZ7401595.1 T9SS type A sorting domain-containing protein [candidate division KSB1 bacterium]
MKKMIPIIIVILAFTTRLLPNSGGITGRTTTGCTCHGTLSAGNSVITISASPDIFSGAGFAAGNTYTLTITVTGGPSGNSGGFNLKASAGSFSNPSAAAKLQSGEVTHKNPSSRTWTVDWTAPTTPTDSVVFNFTGNSVNNNGDSSGDDPTEVARRTAYRTTAIVDRDLLVVTSFQLWQNYPNPFNAETTIGYQIHRPGEVRLRIFDLNGREIFSATQQHGTAGTYFFHWNGIGMDGRPAASGVYAYQVTFNNTTQSRKLILLK